MIDWHSHILPRVDDGSRSVEESLQMLQMLRKQGVDTVVATPHFYADNESAQSFFERRDRAYRELCEAAESIDIRIILGAEVRYYEGISRLSVLQDMRIGDSKLLLLEMPESKWSEFTVKEIEQMSCSSRIRIILAHVERCLPQQKADTLQRLFECGVMMQSNAEAFCDISVRRRMLRLLGNGEIAFIGSDCHDLEKRAPMLDKAYEIIKRKLGEDFIVQMQEYGYSALGLKI